MAKGHIEQLRSGSWRVHVYAGKDPLTGKQLYLRETAPDEGKAAIALGKLLEKAAAGRTPETGATVERLLEVYMEVAELDASTRSTYAGFIHRTLNPALGHLKLRRLRGPLLDKLYAKLRRCGNVACTGKPFIEHRYVPPPIKPGAEPPYRQLAAGLRTDIETGVLPPGEKLPSVKVLATHVGIATDTVQKALKQLRADGLIIGRQGSGTYVTDAPPAAEGTATRPKPRKHDCKLAGCRPHACTPMKPGTIRQIHAILTGACAAADRWDWIDGNPTDSVKLPTARRTPPAVPSPDDVATLIAGLREKHRALKAPMWFALAVYVWLAATTGARRGELCALRWAHIRRICHRCGRKRSISQSACPRCASEPALTAEADYDPTLDSGLITYARNYLVRDGHHIDKDTKTHQERTLALDPATCGVLATLYDLESAHLAEAALTLAADAYIFTNDGGTTPWNPDWTTHKVHDAAAESNVQINIKSLRHYSATELLAAGIDLRNTAHRLGHGSGGATTLKIYAHPVTEVDQRAAAHLAGTLDDLTS